MPTPTRSRNGRSPPTRHEQPDHEDTDQLSTTSTPLTDELRTIITEVNIEANTWRDALAVSIGRASALTGLKETQIRYFEEIGALQPAKTPGASRLYTLTDLRRLHALALLLRQHRPAEAAEIIRAHARQIESGTHLELVDLLQQEGSAITDGFLLVRLMSQLIDAARAELEAQCSSDRNGQPRDASAPPADSPRVIGVILPLLPLFETPSVTFEEVQQAGRALASAPVEMPVALDRGAIIPQPPAQIPPALNDIGRNDTTLLFYSREAWELPDWDRYHYCAYIPSWQPHLTMVLLLLAPQGGRIPHILCPRLPARAVVLDRFLVLCEAIFREFQRVTPVKNYRYRSDGFQIEQTQHAYRHILETVHKLIFPDQPDGMIVLFIPNSLDRPLSLSVLAHHGYDEGLAQRAKLDLSGEGQGLSGRAYNLREPFLSLDASADPRIAYGVEDPSSSALAVPLATSWGIAPFGVVYLASKCKDHPLTSEAAYVMLIIGTVLSELLGRWWLTRLRRTLDELLHQRIEEMLHWFDSLDQHGPDMERALAHIQALWKRIKHGEVAAPGAHLALVVLDIDTYRQRIQATSTAPLPLATQLHVREAIHKIVPATPDFWFKNDHAFLLLEDNDEAQAAAVVRRIANQVRALPLTMTGKGDRRITISVSAAIKAMTYQDLYDLDSTGGQQLRDAMQTIIDDLRERTKHSSGHQIQALVDEGWKIV